MPTLPSRKRRQMLGVCPEWCWNFDLTGTCITNSFKLEQLTTKIREQNSNRHKRYWVLSIKQFGNFERRPIFCLKKKNPCATSEKILAACTRVCRTRWRNLWDRLNTRNAARLRSPSLIMAPDSTRRFDFTDRRGKSSHAHLTTSGHKNDLLRTFEECKQLWWSVVLRLFFPSKWNLTARLTTFLCDVS